MKNALLSLLLLGTLSVVSLAGEIKVKKVKAAAKAKAKKECPASSTHPCCMKRMQA